nr:hypothetical protein [Sinorhizobium meliloti]
MPRLITAEGLKMCRHFPSPFLLARHDTRRAE